MKPETLTRLGLALVLSCASSALAAPRLCEESFVDPTTGAPRTLSLRVDAPEDGAVQRRFASADEGCTLLVDGWASTLGIPTRFDFYVVIDASGSTGDSAGVDLDGDGDLESVLEVEIESARRFVDTIDLTHHRVAIVAFSDSAHVLVHLTQDRDIIAWGLSAVEPGGSTNFGRALEAVVVEHELYHDPTREQAILFLSDGEPTDTAPDPPGPLLPCSFSDSACSGIQWAGEARERGLRLHAFAVGMLVDLDVLAEMAGVGDGQFMQALHPDDLLQALPGLVLAGIDRVTILNATTGDFVEAQLLPDGRFSQPVPAMDHGPNELVVRAHAAEAGWIFVECRVSARADCIDFGCPADRRLECVGPRTDVPGLVAWVEDPSVDVLFLPTSTPLLDASGPYPFGATTLTWEFSDPAAGTATCSTLVDVDDAEPPLIAIEPLELSLDCSDSPPPTTPLVEDGCDDSPLVFSDELRLDGPCPQSYTIERRWFARDGSGNESPIVTQQLHFEDTSAPLFDVIPDDRTVPCDDVPSPPVLTATDGCDPTARVDFTEQRVDGPCPSTYTLLRRWTAADACDNATATEQVVQVVDESPPGLDVPPPVVLECSEAGGVRASDPGVLSWLASASASDSCGSVALAHDAPSFLPSGCGPAGRATSVLFTATDDCGLVTERAASLTVVDTTPPQLGVPAPITLECSGSGGVSRSDPAVQAWLASAGAGDACGAVTLTHDAPALFPAGCGDGQATVVEFTAVDPCGHVTRASSSITVVDTTPPVVADSSEELACLWPPNHRLVEFGLEDFAPVAHDLCDSEPVRWRIEGCASDQPENGLGDGNTVDDCVVSADGTRLWVRAERSGLDLSGRAYAISYVAIDGCGNESAPASLGRIVVPHDARDRPTGSCRSATGSPSTSPPEGR
jgi:hypothetical protein